MVYFIYDTIHDYIYDDSIYYTLDDTTVDAQNHIRKLEEYAKAIPYSSNKLVVPIIIKMPGHTVDISPDDMLNFARRYVMGKTPVESKTVVTHVTTGSKIVATSNNPIMAPLTINKQSGEIVCDHCGKPIRPDMSVAPADINYCYHCGAKLLNAFISIESE